MFLKDLQYAVRSLLRTRGFALTVILTLALGIGANTAIFSVVRGVLLKPLPHKDGDRLVYLRHSIDGPGGENIVFSVPEINDFRDGAPAFAGIAEYSGVQYTLQEKSDAVRMNIGLVTGNYFDVMGLRTLFGRTLNARDDGAGAPLVMVLTHEYWTKRFGADRSVIGRKVIVDKRPVEIVGVAEPAPTFPNRFDALMNMAISEHHTSALMENGRTHRMTEVVARLKPGVTLDRARTEIASVTSRVHAQYKEAYDPGSHHRVTVIPFREVLGEKAELTLYLLMAAATFVLIISCANVTNLTLMRGVRREHELVVRAALGAGTARLRRLLLAENLVLAFAGAALGLLIAVGGVQLLTSLAERYSPRASEIRLDGAVLAFTLTLTVAVALLLSFAPTLAREGKLGSLITGGSKGSSGSVARQRVQRALVVAQVAVSVMLLTGAGLLTRTMLQLSDVKDGLDARNVLTMEVPLGYSRPAEELRSTYDRMKMEVAALPGVQRVAVASTMPLRSTEFQLEVKREGQVLAAGEAMPRAEFRTADPEFFEAAGVPLLAGRGFENSDRQGSALVVIINKTLADRLFPGRSAVGERVQWTGDVLRFIGVSGEPRTVIGVVGDTKDGGLDAEPRGVVYHPFTQEFPYTAGLVIRTAGNPTSLVAQATRLVRGVVPTDPIENVKTVDEIRDESVAPRRLNAALVSSFGVLAVIIAAVGIAGVLAFSVSARTKEIGIRMSIGADGGRVQRMILGEGGILLAAGLAIGVIGSLVATQAIRGLLFGVAPHDPTTLVGVAVAMVAIGVGACWLPALRASKIDPAVTIRGQ